MGNLDLWTVRGPIGPQSVHKSVPRIRGGPLPSLSAAGAQIRRGPYATISIGASEACSSGLSTASTASSATIATSS